MRIIDITQMLSKQTPEWPGDTPFEYKLTWTKEESQSVNVGMITTSTHIGTHIDAPFHFDNKGKKVHELDVNVYVGTARVVDVSGHEEIGVELFNNLDLTGVKRLLLRTNSWTNRSDFPSTIPYIHPDLAPFLAENGIILIGVDVPSVDPLDSKSLDAHHNLSKHGIHILEGIVLNHVEEKDYELIALPLFIEGADGSPVRAILREK